MPTLSQHIEKKENVLLVGNSGTGKTHVASALAFAACAQGHRVRFFTVSGPAMTLSESERELNQLLAVTNSARGCGNAPHDHRVEFAILPRNVNRKSTAKFTAGEQAFNGAAGPDIGERHQKNNLPRVRLNQRYQFVSPVSPF